MADVLDNSLVNSGHSMVMPQTNVSALRLTLKDLAVDNASNTSPFYASVETDFTGSGFDTATLVNLASGDEQLLVSVPTGSGVLTQVVTPECNVGTVTLRVVIDGVDNVFTSEISGATQKLLLGDFAPWAAQDTITDVVGYGSQVNNGYASTGNILLTLLTPMDSATKGLPIGLKFNTSLSVYIESSAGFVAGSTTNKAVACWLNYIPKGV